jgi:hypothetical protein
VRKPFGIKKWFRDNVNPLDLGWFNIAWVISFYLESYILNDS